MRGEADVAAAAALLAEPARAALVVALTEHEALPASALAAHAGIAPSTASEHLRRLVDGGFIRARKNGRHRYFSLADPAVAEAVEGAIPARAASSLAGSASCSVRATTSVARAGSARSAAAAATSASPLTP